MRARGWVVLIGTAALILAAASPCWAPYTTRTWSGVEDPEERAFTDQRDRASTAEKAEKVRAKREALPISKSRVPSFQVEVQQGNTAPLVPSESHVGTRTPAPAEGLGPGSLLLVLVAVGVIAAVFIHDRQRRYPSAQVDPRRRRRLRPARRV